MQRIFLKSGRIALLLAASMMTMVLAVASSAPAVGQVMWYVDDDAAAGGTGRSWSAALKDVHLAVAVARAGDQVWVARGLYTSGRATLDLKDGVALYGGFVGDETSLDERSWRRNPTVLTGEGVRKVVRAERAGADTVLDGFIVERGQTGLGIEGSSFTIRNCRFVDNSGALWSGTSGIHANSMTFVDCEFVSNHSQIKGGVVNINDYDRFTFVNCLFDRNRARQRGGAICISPSYTAACDLINCTFVENEASGSQSWDASAVCIVDEGTCSMENCIVWDNSVPAIGAYPHGHGLFIIEHSIVQELMGSAPVFVDPDGADYRLDGGSPGIDAGNNGANASAFDLRGKPRRFDDPATPNTGLGDPPIIDLGAYEYQGEPAQRYELTIDPMPLRAGAIGVFAISGARPGVAAYLVYSRVGPAQTYVPQLQVMLNVAQPVLAGSPRVTNASGEAVWTLGVPAAGAGRDVWVQSMQREFRSRVFATFIE